MTTAIAPSSQRETTPDARRIRAARLTRGIDQETAARAANLHAGTWRGYERGDGMPSWNRAPSIALALGCPIAQLFTDDLVLAEIRIAKPTLERVKQGGRPEAEAVAAEIVAYLVNRLLIEAMRPPVDTSPGVRAKRRRTRAEVLAGVEAAKAARRAKKQRQEQQSAIE